jgi:hypothetical protein
MIRSDDDTDVTALVPPAEGTFSSRMQPAWNIGRNPNGGCLPALSARALRHRVAARADTLQITVT